MKYVVEITETLRKSIIVEAESQSEALNKISSAYNASEIVLSADDFCGNEMEAHEADEIDLKYFQEWKGEENA